jgi:hypothetical protein
MSQPLSNLKTAGTQKISGPSPFDTKSAEINKKEGSFTTEHNLFLLLHFKYKKFNI